MYTTQQIKHLINTDNTAAFYNDRSWRKLAHNILSEQHNECQLCKGKGKYNKADIVHHVNYLRKRPDLAYCRTFTDVNGIEQIQLLSLCRECHEKIHERGHYSKLKKDKFINDEKW